MFCRCEAPLLGEDETGMARCRDCNLRLDYNAVCVLVAYAISTTEDNIVDEIMYSMRDDF